MSWVICLFACRKYKMTWAMFVGFHVESTKCLGSYVCLHVGSTKCLGSYVCLHVGSTY